MKGTAITESIKYLHMEWNGAWTPSQWLILLIVAALILNSEIKPRMDLIGRKEWSRLEKRRQIHKKKIKLNWCMELEPCKWEVSCLPPNQLGFLEGVKPLEVDSLEVTKKKKKCSWLFCVFANGCYIFIVAFYKAFEYSLHHEKLTWFCPYKFNTASLVLS